MYRAEQRKREADIKAKRRADIAAKAAAKKQMEDEIAWEKANKNKPAEPGVTTQQCYLVNGKLSCK